MTISEELKLRCIYPVSLVEGMKARVKQTGQIVELVRVSEYGISVVAFRSGGEYFMSNKYLEPVATLH